MARFVSADESGSVLGRVERTELALAARVTWRLTVERSESRLTGPPTYSPETRNLFDLKPALVGRDCVQIGNGDFLTVLCVGSLNLVFHMDTPAGESDFHVQLFLTG